jgi:hypothetical protein
VMATPDVVTSSRAAPVDTARPVTEARVSSPRSGS